MTARAEHPVDALPSSLVVELRRAAPSLGIVAVAGRDSMGAAVTAVRVRGLRSVLPCVVETGTEYGDPAAAERAVAGLRRRLGRDVRVFDPVRLSSPKLWHALNGCSCSLLQERFGFWSACSACHLYVHLARVPLAWTLGSPPIIAGERDARQGNMKYSQTPPVIDAEVRVLAHAGVELVTPLRRVDDDARIDRLLGDAWHGDYEAMRCALAGDYIGGDGEARYDEAEQRRYARRFLEPAGVAIVDAWRREPEPDYVSLVRGVLDPG